MPYSKERIIFFVDFLGFKGMIKQSETDLIKYNNLKDALNDVQDLFSNNGYGVEILQFSDSLVISVDKTLPGGVYEIVTSASFAIHLLFSRGFLCKGAITCGKLYHKGNILFGPEFLNVMRLEALEDNPSIKFDEALLDVARKHPSIGQIGFPETEVKFILGYADKVPNSNKYEVAWYKDYGSLVGAGNYGTNTHYADIKKIIEDNINNFTKVRVLKKYLYLKKKFEESEYLKKTFPMGIEAKQNYLKRIWLFRSTVKNNIEASFVKKYWK
jgi:hypothetical protein